MRSDLLSRFGPANFRILEAEISYLRYAREILEISVRVVKGNRSTFAIRSWRRDSRLAGESSLVSFRFLDEIRIFYYILC